ncbi:MAG: type II toxin-antitoxin system RelE/ParE family toxin [Proteobacteria bacterium]|nr:type II toxin-antitoxin system RelE/ParE family toxin [Pseudomonadota bacterium]
MARKVVVVPAAIRDIEDIYRYIATKTGVMTAERVLDGLERQIASLTELSERGNIPKELTAIGRSDYRELHFKPYRIFYRIAESAVQVTAVLDGRRDMSTLLRQRLTR